MIGSFITRILVYVYDHSLGWVCAVVFEFNYFIFQCLCVCRMVFGYAYPAYECYKAVEKNRPEIEQLRFWCQYWYTSIKLNL